MLSFMNINSKEREYTANSTLTRRRTRSQKTSGSLRSKLEVFIWHHVVYIPKSWTTFRGILIHELFLNWSMTDYVIDRRGLCLQSGCSMTLPCKRCIIMFMHNDKHAMHKINKHSCQLRNNSWKPYVYIVFMSRSFIK
jgi:hypothetical protein